MANPAFDDRYVLYFDFLGTRAAATTWPRDRLHQFVDLLVSISHLRSHEEVIGNAQPDGSHRLQITPEITTFSDHVVVSWLDRDIENVPTAYKHLWPDIMLKDAIRVSTGVAEAALRIGLVLRGGFSVGQLFHEGGVAFGAALVEAYELESKFALTPRILVADGVIERLTPMKPEETGSLLCDIDGRWHLNYFARMAANAMPQPRPSVDPVDRLSPENLAQMEHDIAATSRWKRAHIDLIDQQIETLRNAGVETAAMKWEWFKTQFQQGTSRIP